jgi:hypothetical protein
MGRPIRGIIKSDYLDPSVDSASGIYTVGELTNFSIDGVVPSRKSPITRVLESKGGVSNTFVLNASTSTYYDPDFNYSYHFSADGKHIYYGSKGVIHQYDLVNAWDISKFTYGGEFRLPDGEDYAHTLTLLSHDGTKLFTWGADLDDLVRWDLTSPFNVSSAVEAQRVTNWGTTVFIDWSINADGTKLFIQGSSNIRVYDFGTAYDITTLPLYGSPDYNWSDPEGILHDGDYHAWGDNGSVLFINGDSIHPNSVLKWTLSTPYDLSTASFSKAAHMVSDKITSYRPFGIAVSSDGTKIILAIGEINGFTEFALGTPYDPQTVVNNSGTQELHLNMAMLANGLFIKPDGTRAWMTHDEVDHGIAVAEFGFEDSFQASTINYTGVLDHHGVAYGISTNDLYFSSDGTKYYLLNSNTDLVVQYNLSTAWDIRTATYYGNLDLVSQETDPSGMAFKPDGTELYIQGLAGDDVTQYTLSSAWDIKTATYTNVSPVDVATDTYGIEFDSDGTTLWATRNADQIVPHTLTTAWDISTMQTGGTAANIATGETTPRSMRFKPGGDAIFVVGTTRDRILKWNLSTPWDVTSIASANYDSAADRSRSLIEGLHVDSDEQYVYTCDNTLGRVNRIGVSSAGSIESNYADYTKLQSVDVSAQTANPCEVRLSADGTRMYVLQQAADLYQYDLSTAFDVTTATYDTVLDMDATDANTYGFTFKYDGTVLYSIGRGNEINWHNLSSAWDISTATADTNSGTVKLLDHNWNSIDISRDGTKLFCMGETNDQVQVYTLETPYDPTSISFAGGTVRWNPSGDLKLQGLKVNKDGTKLRLLQSHASGTPFNNNSRVKTIELSTANDVSSAITYNTSEPNGLYQYGNTRGPGTITAKDKLLQQSTIASGEVNNIYQFGLEYSNYYGVLDSGVSSILKNLSTNINSPIRPMFETSLDISARQPSSQLGGLQIGDSGNKLYTLSIDGMIDQYNLTVAYDIKTAIYAQTFFVGADFYNNNVALGAGAWHISDWRGIDFSVDGTHVYFGKQGYDYILHYALDTAWDISSLRYVDYIDTTTSGPSTVTGLMISDDGTKLSVGNNVQNNELYIFNLDSAYHVNNMTLDSDVDLMTLEGNPAYFFGSEDKTKFGYLNGNSTLVVQSAFNKSNAKSGIIDTSRINHAGLWNSFTITTNGETLEDWQTGNQNNNNPHYCSGFIRAQEDDTFALAYTLPSNTDADGTFWRITMTGNTSNSSSIKYDGKMPTQFWDVRSSSGTWWGQSVSNINMTSYWRAANATIGPRVYQDEGDMHITSNDGYSTFSSYMTGFKWGKNGTRVFAMDYLGIIGQWDCTTAYDLSTATTALTNYTTNPIISYRVEWASDRAGQFDFSDDGKTMFQLFHNTTYGSSIRVWELSAPWDLHRMKYTGITIAAPMDMATDTPRKLANSLNIKNNHLYVVPWDIGDGTGFRKMDIYYIDLNITKDILRA